MSIIKPPEQEPAFLQPFLSFCHRRRYPTKTDIVHPGDDADTLFYLIDGSVAIIIEDDEGKEIILTYLNKGEFIGEMGLFTPQQPSRSVLVRTRSSCMLAEISYSRLEQLFQTDLKPYVKELLYAMGAQLTQRLLHTSRKYAIALLEHLDDRRITRRVDDHRELLQAR